MAEVPQIAQELAKAVELTMESTVPQEQRMVAYKACEEFKETSPYCVQCGLHMARLTEASHFVKHFGLQLLEHCIKYRWHQMSQTQKLFIKENAMMLLEQDMELHLQEHVHIKDALSRIVVEMIKREWPQQWPTLLSELRMACTRGPHQTELVLLIFLRLAEDVALFQTMESSQRRRDIYQALTTNMGDIFKFFLNIILDHYHAIGVIGQDADAGNHVRVVQVVLLTLTGFVEWVSITHIMADNGHLLKILCLLLDDSNFQGLSAECLLQIVNRKGRVEERKPLLELFNADVMRCIFKAAGGASQQALDEQHYNFLKRLTLVLTGLGTQVCTLWGRDDGLNRPENFSMFLDAILTFSRHPSLTLVHYTNALWMSFFRHEQIPKDEVFLSYIPKWVECTAPKIVKVTYPTSRCTNIHDTGAYACLDYDSEEDFAQFYHQCRSELLQTFRQATLVSPLVMFSYAERWLTTRIQKSMLEPSVPSTECTNQDATYLEWEALSQVLESILSRILIPVERPSVTCGLRLLDICLKYEPSDPLLLSTLLSCVSALFVFLSMTTAESSASLLPLVLDKIFAALVFTQPGQGKDSRSRAVKNVRMHAASLMVKIAQKYPLLLLPVFDQIYATVQGLSKDPEKLSRLERGTLQEALLLISNHFCDYERQTKFIGEVMGTSAAEWIAVSTKVLTSPRDFMAYVGLDRPPVEPSSDDVNGQNRSHMLFSVNLFLAVVKRCSWPEDPDRAARGGFVVAHTQTGNPVCRNPAAPHIVPIIPHLLRLLKVFNGMWTPEACAALSEGYRGAHMMLDVDRANVLGTTLSASFVDHMDICHPRAQTPLDRMRHFLTMVHDTAYHILGNAGPSFGRDFYLIPGLVNDIVQSMFSNLKVVPDYRLRLLVRVFLRPFVISCPPKLQEDILLPVLGFICPYMWEHLNNRWQYITQLYESGGMDEENTDTQEMLEDMLNRTITREYLDVLKVVLVGATNEIAFNAMDQDEMESTKPTSTSLQSLVISELGTMALRNEGTCQPIVFCVLRALYWNDSTASMKATHLAGPMVRLLANDASLTSEVANHIMVSVLKALQMHGQHDGNLGTLLVLGVQMYEILRPYYPGIVEVMKHIPDYNAHYLQKFDDKILGPNQKANKMDKSKKDIFRRLTNQLIGRSMSQYFRKEVKIADLPRLQLRKQTTPPPNLIDTDEEVGLCRLFKLQRATE